MFLDHIISFFHKKSNKTTRQPVSAVESLSETRSTSHVSTTVEAVPIVVASPPLLPQVEFEESRNLLQLDFFGTSDGKEQPLASFPQFDYLLQPAVKEVDRTAKKARKSSMTLRHRISLYRPSSKTVKRSLSSPDIYNQQ